MAVTPQTNTTLPEIAEALKQQDGYVICGHVSPDGDCLGSQLALAWGLKAMGKKVACVLAKDDPVDRTLRFLPGIQTMVPASSYQGEDRCFIAVDVPTVERLGDAAALHDRADFTITIDHHAVPEAMARLSYTDPDAASTTMLIWELLGCLGIERDKTMATCAYTGLMTDTGRFQYQNTDAAAFALAAQMVEAGADPSEISRGFFQNRTRASMALEAIVADHMMVSADGATVFSWLSLEDFDSVGAVKSDAEPMIDFLRSLEGVEVACILREQPGEVRGSLRAKGDADVAAIAREFGGGGHKAAAGLTLHEPFDAAVSLVANRLGIDGARASAAVAAAKASAEEKIFVAGGALR